MDWDEVKEWLMALAMAILMVWVLRLLLS